MQYLNTVFKSQEINCEKYENKLLSITDILYATVFSNENPDNFGNWCSKNKLEFLNRSFKRAANSSEQRTSKRSLFVLKEEFRCTVIEEVMSIKQRHQDYINHLKANGHAVIGYCRKSKARNNEDQVIKSLSEMMLGLQERSLVDETFVSVSCNA